MTDKFQNKYRVPSTRLQNWDYRWNGAYFITICTQNRNCFFGEIDNGKMQLLPVGIIADLLWHEIKNHAKNIELDAFVVMPNHVHGNPGFTTILSVITNHLLKYKHIFQKTP